MEPIVLRLVPPERYNKVQTTLYFFYILAQFESRVFDSIFFVGLLCMPRFWKDAQGQCWGLYAMQQIW